MIETEDSVGATVGNGLHITCSKDDLVQALGVVSRAVSTRTSVQILSGNRFRRGLGDIFLRLLERAFQRPGLRHVADLGEMR